MPEAFLCRAVFTLSILGSALSVSAQQAALTVSGPGQPSTILSLAALNAMPQTRVTVTNGHTQAKEIYGGVPLLTLLEKAGAPEPSAVRGKALAQYVVATGSDGYHAVLSLAEVETGFHPGIVLVADTLDGKPIDSKEGPLKLIVEEDTKPARWVRNLVRLQLKQAD